MRWTKVNRTQIENSFLHAPTRAHEMLLPKRWRTVVVALLILVIGMLTDPLQFIIGVLIIWTAISVVLMIPWSPSRPKRGKRPLEEYPSYTVMTALFKEADMIPQLVQNLLALEENYPGKVQFIILLEEEDEETIDAVYNEQLPENWLMLVLAPDGGPRTKPRALNVGLYYASGELVTVYDAEDRPDPHQLTEAASVLCHNPDIAVVQARLVVTNAQNNIWAILFAAAYEVHFSVILPWLVRLGFVPLGGTSFHGWTQILRDIIGGWDVFNVTEDLAMAAELAAAGYKTAILDSNTYETAPTDFMNRIRQLTRWMMGHIVTYFVFWKHPIWLLRALGLKRWVVFNVVVGGAATLPVLSIVFWAQTFIYFATKSEAIERLYSGPIYYIGLLLMVVGNFLFIYMGLTTMISRKRYSMVKWLAIFTPLHWLMVSAATVRAYWKIATGQAAKWEKTTHTPVVTVVETPAVVAMEPHANGYSSNGHAANGHTNGHPVPVNGRTKAHANGHSANGHTTDHANGQQRRRRRTRTAKRHEAI